MKKISLILGFIALIFVMNSQAQEELSPYFKFSNVNGDSKTLEARIQDLVMENEWQVIGTYHPAEDPGLTVICFTNEELKKLSLQFKDRGALASVLKAAIVEKEGKITVSVLNPEYMFLAYWGEQLNGQEKQLKEISEEAIAIFSSFGKAEPFGGMEKIKDLPDYHYMMMMPYFDDPVELNEFDSFEQGLEVIRKNLTAGKGNTVKVYEQLFEGEKVAVFGIGLLDKEDGEPHFLPIVGEDHIANLPYEIILQGKEATMLHGKYRIALFWPELKMGTFMKISSTPGDIEDVMESLTEDEKDL